MNEVKQPKKPLIYYYAIVLMVLPLFNFMASVHFRADILCNPP